MVRAMQWDLARVAGVDEAGRGPLAGPVVAAAVILHPQRRIRGLADSKILSPAERARLALIIRARALAFGLGWADRDEIDSLNIFQATLLAMRRALLALPVAPTHVRVDGNRCPCVADLELAVHKGYATARHLTALRGRTPSAQHRRSFSPMKTDGQPVMLEPDEI